MDGVSRYCALRLDDQDTSSANAPHSFQAQDMGALRKTLLPFLPRSPPEFWIFPDVSEGLFGLILPDYSMDTMSLRSIRIEPESSTISFTPPISLEEISPQFKQPWNKDETVVSQRGYDVLRLRFSAGAPYIRLINFDPSTGQQKTHSMEIPPSISLSDIGEYHVAHPYPAHTISRRYAIDFGLGHILLRLRGGRLAILTY
jgi:hypothetical protein